MQDKEIAPQKVMIPQGRSMRRRPAPAVLAAGSASMALLAAAPPALAKADASTAIRVVMSIVFVGVVLGWQFFERNAPDRSPWAKSSTVALWVSSLTVTLPIYTLLYADPVTGVVVSAAIAALGLAAFLIVRWR